MKAEEQIFAYKELRNNGQAFFVDNYEDADRIIEALEKQIPKKAIYNNPYGNRDSCPRCDELINYRIDNYCHRCGQLIDWSVEE